MTAANRTIRAAILSFAHHHAHAYAQAIAELSGVELVAIADDDETRGRDAVAAYGGQFYRDYHDALQRTDLDAVVVCSANVQHRDLVVAAAAAGKQVLCEKPLATTRPDALAMIDACRQAGVALQTAFPVRFCAPAIALRDAVRAGVVGTPLAVLATNQGQYPGGWFGDPALAGGGAVMDHTVHVADLLRWIFEREVTSVYAEIGTRLHPDLPTDDVGLLLLELEGGLSASLDCSWSRPKTWPTWGGLTIDIIGEGGMLAMDAFSQSLQVFDDRAGRYRLDPWSAGADLPMVRGFFDAVRAGRTPPVTGEDGLHALEVVLCAYESYRRHAPVANDWSKA
ncbi:MAG: Gfo/Idh/MocA family protein [Thermomicrobiales bacterium]